MRMRLSSLTLTSRELVLSSPHRRSSGSTTRRGALTAAMALSAELAAQYPGNAVGSSLAGMGMRANDRAAQLPRGVNLEG